MRNFRARLAACVLPALLLLGSAACAQQAVQPVRYKFAEAIAQNDAPRYAVINLRQPGPPANSGTVDLQVMGEERFADDPYTYVRTGLNTKLEEPGDDKPLLEKHILPKPIELKTFTVELARKYPQSSKYMNAGSGQGLLGVLVGAVMDGVSNRSQMRQEVTVHIILNVDGKAIETHSGRTYTEQTLPAMLIDCADAALASLAWQLRAEARGREIASNPPPPTGDAAPATQAGDAPVAAE